MSRRLIPIIISLLPVLPSAGQTSLPDRELEEVVVTAREGKSATTSSVIDTTAMQHLQPTSFADLLSLLPGGFTKDPAMGAVNSIALRQAAGASTSDDYATTALGTSFMIDGMPVNTDADLQATPDANHTGHTVAGRGVDMRAISTDDIESVEIVRGIASAEYGEVTSGLVKIKRKQGVSRLEARFKADTRSRLFYVGKGFSMPAPGWTLNVGAGYLDARIDPRNARENYKRVNVSARSNYEYGNTTFRAVWNSALTYTGTFERDNNDPDLTVNNTIDRFSTANHGLTWSNTLSVKPVVNTFLTDFTMTAGLSYTRERLEQERHVASSRVMPMPVSLTPGSNYVGYLPLLYLAQMTVDGRPFTAYVKGVATMRADVGFLTSVIKTGMEWNMSKNFGRGSIYDLERPITAAIAERPRAFSDVPATHQLSGFVELRAIARLGEHTVEFTPGLRSTALPALDSRYALAGKPYLDPRATLSWSLPAFEVAGNQGNVTLTAGAGMHTKMPVAAHLYPTLRYTDFEQLNYYHNNPAYRTMNVLTCIDDVTNYNLLAARNFKLEVRLNLAYAGNNLSVTYFREALNDGFRHTGYVHRYTYRRYDASGYDPDATGHAPLIEELPYREVSYQAVRTSVTNGSSTRKQGIEYTFQSRRLRRLHTRLTVNGAYFHTVQCNSQPLWYKPSIIANGTELQYIGLYDDTDGSVYRSFNTNVMLDTDLTALGLRFSAGVEAMWFTERRTLWRDGVPTSYMDPDGRVHPYTAECVADPYLTQLIRHYTSSAFDAYRVPADLSFNLKATKTLWRGRVGVALYVNRLFTVAPPYTRYGVTIRRYSSPYFGMEINLKL